jgi:hypothetical protein
MLSPVSLFSLPRTAVLARVLMTQGVTHFGELYVMERVPQHDGPETVVEMLNRREAFFAFRPESGEELLLMSKMHTVSVSLDRQAPIADPARLSAAKLLGLEIVLAGGSTLSGWASAELPPQHARLLDYLNTFQEPFFALWTHAATYYVNRAHVMYARPLD